MSEHLSPEEKKAKRKLNPMGWKARHQWTLTQPETVKGLKKEGRFYQMLLKAQNCAIQVLAYQEIFLPENLRPSS